MTLKIAATSVPHADLLKVIQPEMDKRGVSLKIIEVDDYNLPNRLLHEKQVDANFFQHISYLQDQNTRLKYQFVPLIGVHIEPLGLYSLSLSSLEDIKEGSRVVIPNDAANCTRALLLLSKIGLISLKEGADTSIATLFDIQENPKNLKICEMDAAFIARTLEDVEVAAIPANFALQSSLDPLENALAIEEGSSSLYINIVAVRKGEETLEMFKILCDALQSPKLHDYMITTYNGAILPVSAPKTSTNN